MFLIRACVDISSSRLTIGVEAEEAQDKVLSPSDTFSPPCSEAVERSPPLPAGGSRGAGMSLLLPFPSVALLCREATRTKRCNARSPCTASYPRTFLSAGWLSKKKKKYI